MKISQLINMWDLVVTFLAQLTVVAYALNNPSNPSVPDGPSGPLNQMQPLVIGPHYPFTEGQSSLLYLHGQSTAYARNGLLTKADAKTNTLSLNLVSGSSAVMVPVGTGFLHATGRGTISYGYLTGHVTKTLSDVPIMINLAQLVTTVSFRPFGLNSRVETWSAAEQEYGPGTYAVQAFVRGDSGFNLNIGGLNDSFRINFYSDVQEYGLFVLTNGEGDLAQNFFPINGTLTPLYPRPWPPGFDQFPLKYSRFINVVYNGVMWVANIFRGWSFFEEGGPPPYPLNQLAYKLYNEDWTFCTGGFPTRVILPFTTEQDTSNCMKLDFNGEYWLATGFPISLDSDRSGSVYRSNDGINWFDISSSNMGFRMAGIDLKWNGQYWLIVGSDVAYNSGVPVPRERYVLKYDGNELTEYTVQGLPIIPAVPDPFGRAGFDGFSIDYNADDGVWVLIGGYANQFINYISTDMDITISEVYTKTDSAAEWTTVSLGSTYQARKIRYANNRYVITGMSNSVLVSLNSDISTLSAVSMPSMNSTKNLTYMYSQKTWLLGGTQNTGGGGLPILYSLYENTATLIPITVSPSFTSQIFGLGTTDVDYSLWVGDYVPPEYQLEDFKFVRMPHGLQTPDSFIANLQSGVGTDAIISREAYYADNPELLYILRLCWVFYTEDSITFIKFTDRNGDPLTGALAATYGLYENGTIRDEYVLDPPTSPGAPRTIESPGPVYISMPVTWTFRKLGIAGRSDTDGTFRIRLNEVPYLTLGPGLHEFYGTINQLKLYGTFTGVTNQFATLSAIFDIETTLTSGTYSNRLIIAAISILKSDVPDIQSAVVPANGAPGSIVWSDPAPPNDEGIWLIAEFPPSKVYTDEGRDFAIDFDAYDSENNLLGSFLFRTNYYSAQKYTERLSEVLTDIAQGGVEFTAIGAGGGSYTSSNFQKYPGGSTLGVVTEFEDLTGRVPLMLSVNVGYRGSQIFQNGSSGGRNTRVIINNVTIADSGGGGGASLGSIGGDSGLLGGDGASVTPLPAGEPDLHGKRSLSGQPLFGSVASSQGQIYNLRPGGTGGFGSLSTDDGLISDEVFQIGTGTQSNTTRQFFGAGGASEVVFVTPSADPNEIIESAQKLFLSAPSYCQTTNIIQEISTNDDAKKILIYALSQFAKNPIISTDAVIFGTSVAHLNVDFQSPTAIVPSYLSIGPVDEFLPITMSPNCRPLNDLNGASAQLVLNKLCIYDDGQVIYEKVNEYIGTVFYAPGMSTYVTSVRFGSSELNGNPNNRYNCIYLEFTDDLSSSTGPFYWDIPGGFLNGNVITCDGLVGGLRAIVPLNNSAAAGPLLDSVYAAMYNLDITQASPVQDERQLPGTDDYAPILWPSNNLFCELFARPTNGPNSIINGHYEEFDYSGQSIAYLVPLWCTTIKISAFGASGSSSGSKPGSVGSLVVATYRHLAGKTLTFEVGVAGGSQTQAFGGGLNFARTETLGGGSTAVLFNGLVIQGAAGGGSGSSIKQGLSEFDTVWTSADGRPGRSKLGNSGENAVVANGAAGGSGFPGGSVLTGASGGASLVPPNGSLLRGYAGSIGLGQSGKIIVEVY